jgi:hypothetical protein
MTCSLRLALFVPAVLAVVALTGCSEAAKQEMEGGKREAIMETVGETAIEQAADVNLSSGLSCRASESGGGSVSCAGTTSDDEPVTLSGTIIKASAFTEPDWVKGEFIATVNGRKVSLPTCLGAC